MRETRRERRWRRARKGQCERESERARHFSVKEKGEETRKTK